MSYVVDLDTFHGPLDLLLYLIEKNEVDIYDIPIAVISDQYMEYLQTTGEFDLEKLGDFLTMASYLLSIKSRLLLPAAPKTGETEGEVPDDPREELVKKLIDYKRYKMAAEYLQSRQEGLIKRIYFRDYTYEAEQQEEIIGDIKGLIRAYKSLVQNQSYEEGSLYSLPEGDINVGVKMEDIVNYLAAHSGEALFHHLFSGIKTRREALALFLALLELVRRQTVYALQEERFGTIKISLRRGEANADAG